MLLRQVGLRVVHVVERGPTMRRRLLSQACPVNLSSLSVLAAGTLPRPFGIVPALFDGTPLEIGLVEHVVVADGLQPVVGVQLFVVLVAEYSVCRVEHAQVVQPQVGDRPARRWFRQRRPVRVHRPLVEDVIDIQGEQADLALESPPAVGPVRAGVHSSRKGTQTAEKPCALASAIAVLARSRNLSSRRSSASTPESQSASYSHAAWTSILRRMPSSFSPCAPCGAVITRRTPGCLAG